MKGQRITLEDIAHRVGVTKMTVSRFLKDPSIVAKDTGAKIQQAIDELGYVRNRAPIMLSQTSTKTIGLVVSSFSNLLFSDLIEGVEDRAHEQGYEVLIAHTGYKEEEEERKILQLLSYQVDAIILCEPKHSTMTVRRLKGANIPIVELMSLIDNPLDINIGYDHAKVSYAACKGLIQSGRTKIAYMRARLDTRTIDRQKGYEAAMREAGLELHVFGSEVPSNFSRGAMMMRQALQEMPDLDAVYCTNDDVAIGAMIACIELGIKVPEQLAILGYNGLNIGSATQPKLTSIVTARNDMGKMAVDMILKRLEQEENSNFGENKIELYPMLSFGQTITSAERTCISRLFDTLYALKVPHFD